jgi:hypothetical protein
MPSLASVVAVCCSAARVTAAAGMAVAGITILALPTTSVRAAEPLAFTIPAEDGYGIAECMQAGSECGRSMAASWCEAHGHAHVAAYGMADDITGSTVPATPVAVQPGAVVIRCND